MHRTSINYINSINIINNIQMDIIHFSDRSISSLKNFLSQKPAERRLLQLKILSD